VFQFFRRISKVKFK